MDEQSQSLVVTILPGSGSGELESVSGAMVITRDSDGHRYALDFDLLGP